MPAKPQPRMVYPVPGFYLATVPMVPHLCVDDFCVASGAFTTEPPAPAEEPEPEPPAAESKED